MKSPLLSRLKAGVALTAIVAQLAVAAGPASAFCGFYVAQADAKLFNKSSKVVLTRNGQQTAITMASDYEGEPREFALVIPVPTFIKKDQISVVDTKTIDHLDAYTAPRLVEYFDPDPCEDRPRHGAEHRRRSLRGDDGACRRGAGTIAASRSRRVTTSPNTTSRSCRRRTATA